MVVRRILHIARIFLRELKAGLHGEITMIRTPVFDGLGTKGAASYKNLFSELIAHWQYCNAKGRKNR